MCRHCRTCIINSCLSLTTTGAPSTSNDPHYRIREYNGLDLKSRKLGVFGRKSEGATPYSIVNFMNRPIGNNETGYYNHGDYNKARPSSTRVAYLVVFIRLGIPHTPRNDQSIRDFPDHATFREKAAKLVFADKLGVFLSLTLCKKAKFEYLSLMK